MKIFELRVYTLRSRDSASVYAEIWNKHLASLLKFGIETHAVFVDAAKAETVLAIVSYPEGANVGEITKEYMGSEGFKSDMAGFDFKNMVSVNTTLMTAAEASPLK